MKGSTKRREQGLADPLLKRVMERMGLEEVPLYAHQSDTRKRYRDGIRDMGKYLAGPVGPNRREVADPEAMTREVKARARSLGADLVGACELTPVMIDDDVDCPFRNVIAFGHHEDFEEVLKGPEAVSDEAHRSYHTVARIATEMVLWIREELGWDAVAHHNAGTYIQAIPVMWQCGWGELGKHGSLIHPELGASFRPSFITTDLPLVYDAPMSFGVQERCTACQVCRNNCPGDAIPDDFVVTQGVKRWLTDVEKCYPYSRLRKEYCHLCVDVCPYNVDNHRETYMTFMRDRKKLGYKTPKMAVDD